MTRRFRKLLPGSESTKGEISELPVKTEPEMLQGVFSKLIIKLLKPDLIISKICFDPKFESIKF